jgi:hypothetical protein
MDTLDKNGQVLVTGDTVRLKSGAIANITNITGVGGVVGVRFGDGYLEFPGEHVELVSRSAANHRIVQRGERF